MTEPTRLGLVPRHRMPIKYRSLHRLVCMVAVAQLAERLVVVQEVAGSSPVSHPTNFPPVSQRIPGVLAACDGARRPEVSHHGWTAAVVCRVPEGVRVQEAASWETRWGEMPMSVATSRTGRPADLSCVTAAREAV